MDIDIARIISRVLASEQRAREAEERAKKAEKALYQAQCDAEVLEVQLGECQQLASHAMILCDEINRTGHHIREENWVCRNGQPGRTLIPNQIHNLMVEIQRIDQDSEEEESEDETAAPDDDDDWSVVEDTGA